MTNRPGMRKLNAELPVTLYSQLEKLADRDERTMAGMVRFLVRRYVEEQAS